MRGGGFFNLAKTMVSVIQIQSGKAQVEKPKYETLEVMQPRIKNKSELPVSE